jgi:tRNA A37 threonylcarbamoyladenosine synthetase subunit TsaC/SUA5/YrdC
MKIAAVAVGGVVVGALTAGIGLVPYITVVGLTAVAGGAEVLYSYKRPSNSRLILSCESMSEALEWKKHLESQVIQLLYYLNWISYIFYSIYIY